MWPRRRQGVLIVISAVQPYAVAALEQDLEDIDEKFPDQSPLDALRTAHFFRWAIIKTNRRLRDLPDTQAAQRNGDEGFTWLILSSNYDGARKAHVAEIARELGRGVLSKVYQHCEGSPVASASPEAWIKYLEPRQRDADLAFNGALYRSVDQIRKEEGFWQVLQQRLDDGPERIPGPWCDGDKQYDGPEGWKARDLRTEIQYEVASSPDLERFMKKPSFWWTRPLPRIAMLFAIALSPLLAIFAVFLALSWVSGPLRDWGWLMTLVDRVGTAGVWGVAVVALVVGAVVQTYLLVFRHRRTEFRWTLAALGLLALVTALFSVLLTPESELESWRRIVILPVAGYLGGLLTVATSVGACTAILLHKIYRAEEDDARKSLPKGVAHREGRPDDREDRYVQNAMTALSTVRANRLVQLKVVLNLINLASTYFFEPARHLGGLTTIHFGYWTVLEGDGESYLLFMSNYDGSFREYLSDFAKRKTHRGVNAVWSHCKGFPPTRDVFKEGANTAVEEFITFGRNEQVPTQVWYSAYHFLTAVQINRTTRVRYELHRKLSPERTRRWVELLASHGGAHT